MYVALIVLDPAVALGGLVVPLDRRRSAPRPALTRSSGAAIFESDTLKSMGSPSPARRGSEE